MLGNENEMLLVHSFTTYLILFLAAFVSQEKMSQFPKSMYNIYCLLNILAYAGSI